ncbi:MAG: hypothetical protein QXS91_03440 [Candidatus Anstonellales archaeon]
MANENEGEGIINENEYSRLKFGAEFDELKNELIGKLEGLKKEIENKEEEKGDGRADIIAYLNSIKDGVYRVTLDLDKDKLHEDQEEKAKLELFILLNEALDELKAELNEQNVFSKEALEKKVGEKLNERQESEVKGHLEKMLKEIGLIKGQEENLVKTNMPSLSNGGNQSLNAEGEGINNMLAVQGMMNNI